MTPRLPSDLAPLRLAVIGAGHLGRIHARLANQLSEATLTAVVDPVEASRTAVATELQVATFNDYHPILAQFDAAIVATPTQFHHAVVMELLEHGKHVLVEKPIASTSAEAAEMVAAATEHKLTLQVGHVERFNPAWMRVRSQLPAPSFLSARRHAPYTCRSTDVGVVLDLMIHDLDVVLNLLGEEVVDVQAVGAPVVGPHEDWAEARLTFASGCIAQFSAASRVSPAVVRSLDLAGPQGFATVDFGGKTARTLVPSDALSNGSFDLNRLTAAERVEFKEKFFEQHLRKEDLSVNDHNAILEEQRDFVRAIQSQTKPQVTGHDGWRALATAERIVAALNAPQAGRLGDQHALRGPHWSSTRVPSPRKAG